MSVLQVYQVFQVRKASLVSPVTLDCQDQMDVPDFLDQQVRVNTPTPSPHNSHTYIHTILYAHTRTNRSLTSHFRCAQVLREILASQEAQVVLELQDWKAIWEKWDFQVGFKHLKTLYKVFVHQVFVSGCSYISSKIRIQCQNSLCNSCFFFGKYCNSGDN